MNHSVWAKGRPITLPEILDAREKRAYFQQEMLQKRPRSLLSFTLNIAGPVKVFPYTKWLYTLGYDLIHQGIFILRGKILEEKEQKENTGYEAIFALDLEPERIKEYLLFQEENHPLGRLFDLDVLRPDGTKVSRRELGFPERTCLICQNPSFLCGRSRTHSAEELIQHTVRLIDSFYCERMSVHVGLMMQKALFYEVNTALKPGLVDRLHNGSHKDMCRTTFIRSAYALTPYFIACAREGLTFSGTSEELPRLFQKLRTLGVQAENHMLTATGGVNTHKGIIFSGGILCAAAGYAKAFHATDFCAPDFPALLGNICRFMLTDLLRDYDHINPLAPKSNGEKLYLLHNITGIRGEACKGFPHLLTEGLPLFENVRKSGFSLNDSGLFVLLHYIAHTEDTNLIIRSSYETALKIRTELSAFLEASSYEQQLHILPDLDRCFTEKNISPGGSADMLALTYFLYFLMKNACCFT